MPSFFIEIKNLRGNTIMKFWKYTWLMLTMTMSLFGLSACQDDDDYSLDKFAIEIMTVVPDGSTYYLT